MTAQVTSENTTYSFQYVICGQLTLPNGCPNTDDGQNSACYNAVTGQNNAAVCSTFPIRLNPTPPGGAFGTNCFGQYATTGSNSFTTEPIPTGGVTLRYNGGDVQMSGQPAFTSIISVVCDKSVTGPPTSAVTWTPGMTAALFTVRHASGCGTLIKSGHIRTLSGGSVCLIILAVAIPLYIIGGICYNRYMKGRSGTAMIPNHSFWTSLPGLCADGFRFMICRPIVGAAPNQEYETVE